MAQLTSWLNLGMRMPPPGDREHYDGMTLKKCRCSPLPKLKVATVHHTSIISRNRMNQLVQLTNPTRSPLFVASCTTMIWVDVDWRRILVNASCSCAKKGFLKTSTNTQRPLTAKSDNSSVHQTSTQLV